MLISGLLAAGQFFQNTNWFMTGVVLAWIVVTIGYVIVRATESLSGLSTGILIYGIWVLCIEVSSSSLMASIYNTSCLLLYMYLSAAKSLEL